MSIRVRKKWQLSTSFLKWARIYIYIYIYFKQKAFSDLSVSKCLVFKNKSEMHPLFPQQACDAPLTWLTSPPPSGYFYYGSVATIPLPFTWARLRLCAGCCCWTEMLILAEGALWATAPIYREGEKKLGKITRTFIGYAYDHTKSPTKLTTMPLESLTNWSTSQNL